MQKFVADLRRYHWLLSMGRESGVLQGLVFRSFPREHGDDGDHICKLVSVAVIARLDVGLMPALQLQRTPGWSCFLDAASCFSDCCLLTCRLLPCAERLSNVVNLKLFLKASICTSWYLPSCVILQELASVS